VNVEPFPSWESRVIFPPWDSTIAATWASPKSVSLYIMKILLWHTDKFLRRFLSDMLSGIPTPLSVIVSTDFMIFFFEAEHQMDLWFPYCTLWHCPAD
jgi:hypothetical protein